LKTFLDKACYDETITRLRSLRPETRARWGHFTAPRMIVHLVDQMRHTLGDLEVPPRYGPLRWPIVKPAMMFWIPWPKGRIKGPPEMFTTQPANWNTDLATLESLLARFVGENARAEWPDHAYFGRMDRLLWGRFCHRHFDHHLRQFGV
jgi:hypothetical protein